MKIKSLRLELALAHRHELQGRVGACVARLASTLQRRAERGLGDESVLHINAHALLVHPTLAIVRVAREVRWVLLPGRCRLVISLIRPKLITVKEDSVVREKHQ